MVQWLEQCAGNELIKQVANRLSRANQKIVLAESCTGGLGAAMLATIPGISQWLVGSFVTYREQSKVDWLNVPLSIATRDLGVGQSSSETMALAALEQASEAIWAAAITGHLGPNAPQDLDGRVFIAVAKRVKGDRTLVKSTDVVLPSGTRQARQWLAAEKLWAIVLDNLE